MAAAKPIPIGVHFNKILLHVSQPPAANNHQSNTDNIVQPAPAFQFHDFRILFNLPFLDDDDDDEDDDDEDAFWCPFVSVEAFVENCCVDAVWVLTFAEDVEDL